MGFSLLPLGEGAPLSGADEGGKQLLHANLV